MRLATCFLLCLLASPAHAQSLLVTRGAESTLSFEQTQTASVRVVFSPRAHGLFQPELRQVTVDGQVVDTATVTEGIVPRMDGPDLILDFDASRLRSGKYALWLQFEDGRDVDVVVTIPAPKLAVDVKRVNVRVDYVLPPSISPPTKVGTLTIREKNRVPAAKVRGHQTEPAGADWFTLSGKDAIAGGGAEDLMWMYHHGAPLGVTEGEVEIHASEQSEALVVPVRIDARLHMIWLFLMAALGAVTGNFARVSLPHQRALAAAQARLDALQRDLEEALGRVRDDTYVREVVKLRDRVVELIPVRAPGLLVAEVDKIRALLREADRDLQTRYAEATTAFSELREAIEAKTHLSSGMNDTFDDEAGAIQQIAELLVAQNAAAATQELKALESRLRDRLAKDFRNERELLSVATDLLLDDHPWRARGLDRRKASALQALDGLVRLDLTPEHAIAQWTTALGRLRAHAARQVVDMNVALKKVVSDLVEQTGGSLDTVEVPTGSALLEGLARTWTLVELFRQLRDWAEGGPDAGEDYDSWLTAKIATATEPFALKQLQPHPFVLPSGDATASPTVPEISFPALETSRESQPRTTRGDGWGATALVILVVGVAAAELYWEDFIGSFSQLLAIFVWAFSTDFGVKAVISAAGANPFAFKSQSDPS